MSNAAIQIVNIATTNRGEFRVAVYETASLGWAANYGALETYHHASKGAAIASLKLSLEVCRPAPGADTDRAHASTLRCAERGIAY